MILPARTLVTSRKPDARLCADELFSLGVLAPDGRPFPAPGRVLVFRGNHAVYAMTPIIGTPTVSVSYVSEFAVVSALTSLFNPDFEFHYLH